MGRLDDAQWWWNVALDGVVGAVFAGLVTVLVLVLTLRYENARREAEALEAACQRHIERTRQVRDQLVQKDPAFFSVMFFEWRAEARILVTRANRANPRFAELLEVAIDQAMAHTSGGFGGNRAGFEVDNLQEAMTALQNVETLLGHWVSDRRHFDRLRELEVANTKEAIKSGGFIS